VIITRNTVVSLFYTLTNDSGSVFETNIGSNPLCYVHGTGIMISGLEEALEGLAPGEGTTVRIQPEEGYGRHRNDLIKRIPKHLLDEPSKLQVGMRFRINSEDNPSLLTVIDTSGDHVTLDANHPLAGSTLQINVEIVSVRYASEVEISTRRAQDREEELTSHSIPAMQFMLTPATLH